MDIEYIEYIGTNKKWMPNSNEGQICSKFANECMKLPSKATLPIASFSKQQYPARERMTSLSLYLSGNKIVFILYVVIVLCILYLSQVSPGSWQLQFLHGLS